MKSKKVPAKKFVTKKKTTAGRMGRVTAARAGKTYGGATLSGGGKGGGATNPF